MYKGEYVQYIHASANATAAKVVSIGRDSLKAYYYFDDV